MGMRKLAALILVFGLAAMANAGLTLNVSETLLMPSDSVTISIMGDGVTAQPQDCWLIANGPGTTGGTILVYTGDLSSVADFAVGDGSDILETFIQPAGFTLATTAMYANFAAGAAGVLSGTLSTSIFHCEGIGDVMVSLMSADLSTVMDSVIIQQIPEPMTLALLGLGGLFIRRR